MRAKAEIETLRKEREAIIFTEIPYQVNKAALIERIAELVQEKKIEGISDLRDESDRDGMRIVIELKRDAVADVVLEPALAPHRAAIELRRQHDRAQRRPAGAADAARRAARLRRLPRDGRHAAHQVPPQQGARQRASAGRPRHRGRQYRRGDPPDPHARPTRRRRARR